MVCLIGYFLVTVGVSGNDTISGLFLGFGLLAFQSLPKEGKNYMGINRGINSIILTEKLIRDYWPEIEAIDKDIIGEPWNQEHFAVTLPGKWECSWMLVKEGQILGFVVSSCKHKTLHIHRLGVQRSFRRKGIGRQLLKIVAQCAIQRDLPIVTLKVSQKNTDAIAFYYRLGFNLLEYQNENIVFSINARSLLELSKEGSYVSDQG